jgi:hypothetical protein
MDAMADIFTVWGLLGVSVIDSTWAMYLEYMKSSQSSDSDPMRQRNKQSTEE